MAPSTPWLDYAPWAMKTNWPALRSLSAISGDRSMPILARWYFDIVSLTPTFSKLWRMVLARRVTSRTDYSATAEISHSLKSQVALELCTDNQICPARDAVTTNPMVTGPRSGTFRNDGIDMVSL
jgi:hypothetical protein